MRAFKGSRKQAEVVAGSALLGASLTPEGLPWWLRIIVTSILSALGAIIEKLVENKIHN